MLDRHASRNVTTKTHNLKIAQKKTINHKASGMYLNIIFIAPLSGEVSLFPRIIDLKQ